MIINREDYCLEYALFLVNETYEQEKIVSIMNSTLLAESVNKLDYVTEASLDSLKAFIDKIVQSIADAWGKFINNAQDFFLANDKYLTKYENIILKNKVAKGTLKDFYNYDLDKIKNFNIPNFDYDRLTTVITEDEAESKAKFISEYFSDFNKDEKLSFSNNVKNILHGGDAVEMQTTELKMKDIYDYAKGYKTTIVAAINKDIDKLKEANTKAYSIINKMKTKSTDKVDIKSESYDFNSTINYYFAETDIIDAEPEKETGNSNASTSNPEDPKSDNSATTTEPDEFKKDEKTTKIYFNICSEFLAAKLSVSQEAYKTYMKIIKWHVKHYIKDVSSTDDTTKVEPTATDNKETPESTDGKSNNDKLDNAGKQ